MIDPCESAPEYIRAIAPYQPGKPISELERELGITDIVKLASNENPLGPSPLALAAMAKVLPELALYPDGNAYGLKSKLAARFGLPVEQVVIGNGSNDLLNMAGRAFLSPSASAVYSQHAFVVYPLAVQMAGATGIVVPARDYGHDVEAMAAAIRADTRIVFVANPNNPTGTFVGSDRLLAFLKKVPPQVLIVLDEAYTEFIDPDVRPQTETWLASFPNLFITRTFSKAYGLAGLRVGFGLAGRPVADLLNRVREPFNANSLALVAAEAALDDADFLRRTVDNNAAGLRQLEEGFRRLGLDWIRSRGNFVCVRVGRAGDVYQALLRQGVIVRPVTGYGLPEHLRVSVGLPHENDRCLSALAKALGR
jgi:histidinol-phosphate aminotransferase